MDAIIGRYRIGIERTGLILKHQSGIIFDLTPEEALAFLDFIRVFRETLSTMERDTDARLERVVLDEEITQEE